MAFRDLKADFDRLGYRVVGISPDPVAPLHEFKEKNGLLFLFLSDVGAVTAQKHGVWVEKSMYGKTYTGVARSTFVVGSVGNVQAVYFNVKPQGHAEYVRDAIEGERT